MKTERLATTEALYNESVKKAAEILKSGGIVAIPTETVYGLAASAYDKEAIEKVFLAKGRPQDNPLIVHIAEMDMLNDIAKDIPQIAKKCAEKFWPGPFTMVLKRTDRIPSCVSAGLDTVAIRMPSNPIARDIIKECNLPLAAPSANTSGKPSPTSPQYVIEDLDGKINAVVIGQDSTVGVESTVVSFLGKIPSVLRPGGITVEQLKELIPEITVDKAVLSKPSGNERVASPGMKYKHYAPKTDAYLVEGTNDRFVEFVNSHDDSAAICFDEEIGRVTIDSLSYGSCLKEETLARHIFTVLREVDKLGVNSVYIHAPSKSGVGLAVYNRLIRAAAFRVIKL